MLDEKVSGGRAACPWNDIVRNVGIHSYDASWNEFRIGECVLLADLCIQEPSITGTEQRTYLPGAR